MAGTDEETSTKGYHRLADLMGHYPETAIFRRFGALNMLNLLSLQAELIDLQVQFRDIWVEDDASVDLDEKDYSTYFRKLVKSETSLQYEMLLEVRKKLQEYNSAAIQASQMNKLPSPEKADVQFLRDWLTGTGDGDNFLREREKYTWDLPKNSSADERKYLDKDLFTIRSGIEEQDIFSRLLSSSLLDAWSYLRWAFDFASDRSTLLGQQKRRFSKSIDPDSGLLHYSEAGILRVNNVFISVIGAALPIVAIVVLWVIKTEHGRIAAMAGFTVLFALVLATCTNARRLETAASTAAFAAVEVVFIGSDLGKAT
ncbi:hypothetical protein KC318_g2947 [Hortaea werneckii]|nr:hypothetical protein KC334_g3374 [Hortaea werneckii]KAI7009839.1 hypothetical protein KC355_g6402 [Hortaea werneckii]KAI7178513.1 hypothetical protein KC324_g9479 [Hortaea werneckii]KAI7579188.1 hypothetical protein KC316_g9533 [Hortaea werneckii]KAI7672299.1 hypothetical protein KC318_g2947 [Hortaea werneckii]